MYLSFFSPSSTSCIVNITFVALLYCFLLLSFLFMLFLFSHVILPCLWLSVFCNVKTGGVPVQNMPVRDSFYLPVQTPYSEWFLGQSKYKQVELQLKRNRTSRRISSVSLLIRQSLPGFVRKINVFYLKEMLIQSTCTVLGLGLYTDFLLLIVHDSHM